MTKKYTITLLLILSSISFSSMGASKKDSLKNKSHNFISLKYYSGDVMPTNDFVSGDNKSSTLINYYSAIDARYGIQTDGSKDWHHLFNFPYYGVGLYSGFFPNEEELGYPTALHGFLGGAMKRYKRSAINYELGFGVTWNWTPYDEETNPFNTAIGSYNTVFINAAVNYTYQLSNRWDLIGDVSFTHFSNGSVRKPNNGLNLLSPSIELRYHLNDERVSFQRKEIKPFDPLNEYYLFFSGGSKQVAWDKEQYEQKYHDINFFVGTLSGGWLRQFSHSFKAGVGVDLSYDTSLGAELEQSDNGEWKKAHFDSIDKFTLGVMGNVEGVMGPLSVWGGVGAYVLRKDYEDDSRPILYQRAGIKYHFNNNIFVGIHVRAYRFSVADYIEWTVGYRWNK